MPYDPDPEMEGPPLPEELLASFGAGAPDAARRRKWLAEHLERAAELARTEQLWRLTEPPSDHASWPELLARIERAEHPLRFTLRPPHRRIAWPWPALTRIAAVLLLGLALGTLAPRLFSGPSHGRTVVSVPPGATAALRLPGGVVAHLNAASTLSFMDGSATEVELEGEGYFEVPHDPSRRFSVRTSAGVVRDLGTAFDVRVREHRVQVAVTEGTVRLEAAGQAVTVPAGEESSATAGDAPLPPVAADVAAARAWVDGKLVFIDAPLAEVAAEMARHFGTPFRVRAALRDRRITATIRTRSSADAAGAICAALAARCQPRDGGWLITPNP